MVGGAVRDVLAGRATADVDLATPDLPATVVERLSRAGIRTVPTGLAHGTVTAVLDRRPFEITTLRRDVRTDGRRAEIAWTSDWHEDAARRDFTINAMSVGRDDVLHDWFGGRADLSDGRVRFVGRAATRIEEDHLRILRFFRFFARYGAGDPDPEATEAIAAGAGLLRRLSAERVWGELRRLLSLADPVPTVALMERLGVLATILPEGADTGRFARLMALGPPDDPVLRAAALLRGDADGFALRMRLSGHDRRRLAALAAGQGAPVDADDPALRVRLADLPPATLAARSWLDQADSATAAGGGDEAWSGLRRRIGAMAPPVFPIAGRDAVAAGARPGPEIGEALERVRRWWLQEGASPDRAACLRALRLALERGADYPPASGPG